MIPYKRPLFHTFYIIYKIFCAQCRASAFDVCAAATPAGRRRGKICILCGGRRKKIVKYAKKITKKENVLIKFFFLV